MLGGVGFMTRKIRLSYGNECTATSISNIFIDNFMADAHGSYVKVYIYLIRCVRDPSMSVSISNISDKLDETEKDIVKALKYWADRNLLSLEFDPDGQVSSISISDLSSGTARVERTVRSDLITNPGFTIYPETPQYQSFSPDSYLPDSYDTVVTEVTSVRRPASASVEPVKPETDDLSQMPRPNYTVGQMEQFRNFDEFNNLINYIEERLCKTLTQKDLQTPAFLFESLGFSAELIRYLYDYCIGLGKKSSAYIEKVARSWVSEGIDTIEKAQTSILEHSAELAAVRKAFGINRPFGAPELEFISKWTNTYKMNPALIAEACSRTLIQTGKPAFGYTDKILTSWNSSGITTLDEVRIYEQARDDKARAKRQAPTTPNTSNKFAQFPQRTYTKEEYAEIERRKLGLS